MGCPNYPNYPTAPRPQPHARSRVLWGTPRKALMRFDFGLPHTAHTSNTR